MLITIKELANIFSSYPNDPIDEEDCELYCMFIEDIVAEVEKKKNVNFQYTSRVCAAIKMLKYDDGNGMRMAYTDAILSIGVLLKWLEENK